MTQLVTRSLMALAFFAGLCGVASAQPVITQGTLLDTQVDVTKPDASPVIKLTIANEGATFVELVWQGPSGEFFYQDFEGAYYGQGFLGKQTFQGYYPLGAPSQAFNTYSESGGWTLNAIYLYGQNGGNQYTGQALAALFNTLSITVTNPNPPDIIPPSATGGKIKTPVVSIANAPTIVVDMNAADNLSGIANLQVSAENVSGGSDYFIYASAYDSPAPLTKGTFRLYGAVDQSTPTGTYTINYVSLYDIAGNYTEITDPQVIAKLFHNKTTITVNP